MLSKKQGILLYSLPIVACSAILVGIWYISTIYAPEAEEASQESILSQIPPVMRRIAQCESENRQFDADGDILTGEVNPADIGKYQINMYYHLNRAEKLGFDIFTEEGNEGYAMYLFYNDGTVHWEASEYCWLDEPKSSVR